MTTTYPDSDANIVVRHLSSEFRTNQTILPVLDNLSFDIPTGRTIALVGPSGCGKSTLLRILAGMDLSRKSRLHTTGEVSIGGLSPAAAIRTGQTALVPQTPCLLPWRTVYENASLPFEVKAGVQEAHGIRIAERIQSDLRRVGLGAFANALPIELSGGMQSRLAVVRAIVCRPKVMLLDEPFGALDEITRLHLHQEIDAICIELGCTNVLVTHSVQEAVFLADKIIVLSKRPASIIGQFDVPQERPRKADFLHSSDFHDLARQIIESMDRSFTSDWKG